MQGVRAAVVALALPVIAGSAAAAPSFTIDLDDLTLVGDATKSGAAATLVTNTTSRVGAAWTPTTRDLALVWDTSFQFRFRNEGGSAMDTDGLFGGDGLALVFQNAGAAAIGKKGGGLGFRNIPGAIAVEIDMWENAKWGDANGAHIAIVRSNMTELARYDLAANLLDGAKHTLDADYDGSTLDIALDGSQVLSYALDLGAEFIDTGGQAYVGVTAATGGLAYADLEIFQNGLDLLVAPIPAPPTLLAPLALAAFTRRRSALTPD